VVRKATTATREAKKDFILQKRLGLPEPPNRLFKPQSIPLSVKTPNISQVGITWIVAAVSPLLGVGLQQTKRSVRFARILRCVTAFIFIVVPEGTLSFVYPV
jgi:hypothetical protein